MAIADSTLLLEGQQDFSGGMDSSRVPNLIAPNAVSRAVNVTFRGGTPTTRPGFRQLPVVNALEDAFDGINYFVNGLNQGSFFYQDPRPQYNPCLFCLMSGHVLRIDLGTYEIRRVRPIIAAPDIIAGLTYTIETAGTTNWVTYGAASLTAGTTFISNTTTGAGTGTAYLESPMNRYDDAYFVQAENFLIIQDGTNFPRIWDGDSLFVTTLGPALTLGKIAQVPIGKFMAYGQGRLYVTDVAQTTGTAGDLAYGGSTDQKTITSGAHSGTRYRFLTSTVHGFNAGDVVTVSGHSSEFGLNGTWSIANIHSTTEFDIDFSNTLAKGNGGFVAKANAGTASDLLRFTETTYLDEGGSLQVPGFLGKITGLIFMPVQDVGSGQGDLLVFCETGVVSLAVSVPRTQWKSTAGFQRIALASIGAPSHDSLTAANGDIFFRSFDGLRTYRNARAEFNSFGRVPMSAEMNSIMEFDTKNMLRACSAIVFDNRFLFTAIPEINYSGISNSSLTKRPVTFSAIVALDFTTLASVGAQRASAYEGTWRGLDIVKLVAGVVNGTPRAFAFCVDYEVNGTNALWELTTDAYTDQAINSSPSPIKSILETRSFALGSPSEVKKLIRADLWIGSLRGDTQFLVYWRPDEYPCWREWHTFSRCATVDNCVITGVGTEFNQASGIVTLGFSTSTIKWYRILASNGGGPIYTVPIQFPSSENAIADAAALAAALTGAGIVFSTVTRTGTYPNLAYFVSGANGDFTVVPVKTPGGSCEDMFSPKNLQPQYRPQIRLPTPPEDADPIVGRPYYFGNDFQFRIEWIGHTQMTRFLVLGQRQLEQYQGTDYVEVV